MREASGSIHLALDKIDARAFVRAGGSRGNLDWLVEAGGFYRHIFDTGEKDYGLAVQGGFRW